MATYIRYPSSSGGGAGGLVQIQDSLGSNLLSNGASALKVDGSAVTQPVSAASLPLPTGAATSAAQTTGNTSLASIDGKLASLGQKTMAGSEPVVIASDQSAIPVTGTFWQTTQPVSGTVTANIGTTNGLALDASVQNVQGSASGGAVATKSALAGGQYLLTPPTLTNAQQAALQLDASGNLKVNVTSGGGSNASVSTTGATVPASATYVGFKGSTGNLTAVTLTAAGALPVDGSASTQPVSIASSVQVKDAVNVTASGSAAAATVSTVATLTAPANAVGFVLQCLDTSTANIRWAIGRTASATLGQQLQPGRDTGFIPSGANVTICAESGTQNYDIQWVSQ